MNCPLVIYYTCYHHCAMVEPSIFICPIDSSFIKCIMFCVCTVFTSLGHCQSLFSYGSILFVQIWPRWYSNSITAYEFEPARLFVHSYTSCAFLAFQSKEIIFQLQEDLMKILNELYTVSPSHSLSSSPQSLFGLLFHPFTWVASFSLSFYHSINTQFTSSIINTL